MNPLFPLLLIIMVSREMRWEWPHTCESGAQGSRLTRLDPRRPTASPSRVCGARASVVFFLPQRPQTNQKLFFTHLFCKRKYKIYRYLNYKYKNIN